LVGFSPLLPTAYTAGPNRNRYKTNQGFKDVILPFIKNIICENLSTKLFKKSFLYLSGSHINRLKQIKKKVNTFNFMIK